MVPHTVNNENVNVTFPQTQAGYSNSSEDVCPSHTGEGTALIDWFNQRIENKINLLLNKEL